ncbi:ATP-binding protein [Pacificibacter sp. AS14]|uniref:sensor histidine kinase n=1 Tax=Pacificibacter sp. AS14 TaxID=3135785 RepID=UPI00317B7D13
MRSLIISLCAALCLAAIAFVIAGGSVRARETQKAEGRLSLYRSTVVAEIERFSHLPYVLSRDPHVVSTTIGGERDTLNLRLREFAARAGVDAIYLMRPDGETIAASNAHTPASFVGQNYSFRPYFQQALTGEQGRFYGIGSTTGLPGYFIASPVFGPSETILGVIALKLDLTRLERDWRDAGEKVLLANDDSVVVLASNSEWRYRTLSPLNDEQLARITLARQFANQALKPLDWQQGAQDRIRIDGQRLLHLKTSQMPHDWVLHYMTSEEPITTVSWLAAVSTLILAAGFVIAFQFRRTLHIGAALRQSEAEEVELRRANERLAVEIVEREAAQRRLQRAQGELERASRLAALGELAASVTHELGQPIAAFRNHIAAAEMSANASAVVMPKLSGLVDRMEGITRQLRFFARPGAPDLKRVNLDEAMTEAIALIAPNLEGAGAAFSRTKSPTPVFVHGSQLRIEQVMTNLLRNAVDAVEDSPKRELDITVGQTGPTAWFELRDTGHGLGQSSLEDLQEPFVTIRESGRGMGLGLAISASIVKEHGGTMQAHNSADGGAVFRVEFQADTTVNANQETDL